jgi:hypothetical protein
MTSYQVMVEGVFVYARELEGDIGGFQTTFFLSANNASNAVHRIRDLLTTRMDHHGVAESKERLLKSYYWVHDIWEITEDRLLQEGARDSGFTFFRIRWYEKIYLALRRIYFERFKPWLLVSPS